MNPLLLSSYDEFSFKVMQTDMGTKFWRAINASNSINLKNMLVFMKIKSYQFELFKHFEVKIAWLDPM
jgi:hypothetical protein